MRQVSILNPPMKDCRNNRSPYGRCDHLETQLIVSRATPEILEARFAESIDAA